MIGFGAPHFFAARSKVEKRSAISFPVRSAHDNHTNPSRVPARETPAVSDSAGETSSSIRTVGLGLSSMARAAERARRAARKSAGRIMGSGYARATALQPRDDRSEEHTSELQS